MLDVLYINLNDPIIFAHVDRDAGNRAEKEMEIYTVPNDYSYPTKVTNNGAGENNLQVTQVCDFDGTTGPDYNCKFIQTSAEFEFGNPFERDDCCAP